MLRNLLASSHWSKAGSAYRKGDDSGALAHAETALRRGGRPKDFHWAFYATLLVLNHRSEEAEPIFAEVASGETDRSRWLADTDYVRAYSAFYLALIQRKEVARNHWRAAQARRIRSFTRAFLPLPPTPDP